MPINYYNSIIYKLCCKDTNIKDIYIGSTTNFTRRKHAHKSCSTCSTNKDYNSYKYTFIRDNGEWNNWDMIQIQTVNATNKRDLEIKEREYIELFNPSLNAVIPTRTAKEYREANKHIKKQYNFLYRDKNKDEINSKNDCICGGKYTTKHKSEHLKSNKHQKFIKQ